MHARRKTWRTWLTLLAWGVAIGCSGGGGGGADGASGASGGGTVTFSCTVTGAALCTQLLIPATGPTLGQEQQQCTQLQNGTSGTGCATTGLVGCCLPRANNPSKEEQCYYSATEAMTGMTLCTTMNRTWSTTM
jgi:hypothetical protein